MRNLKENEYVEEYINDKNYLCQDIELSDDSDSSSLEFISEVESEIESDIEDNEIIKKKPKSMDKTDYDDIDQCLRNVFGFVSFRHGQRWAIDRTLNGSKSLLVMPTGAGESIIY